jgi:ferredoxin
VRDTDGRPWITVDRALCMGSGVCIAFAPATFAHDAVTKAVILAPDGDPVGDVRAAAEGCPTGAIVLVDQGGA